MLIVETGVLDATADRNDNDHIACRTLLETDDGPLVTTTMIIAEAAYMIDRQVGTAGELALYDSIIDGTLSIETLTPTDWQRVRELVGRYQDLPLGGSDASLIAIAERFGAIRIATLDQRHFRVVRPTHCHAFSTHALSITNNPPTARFGVRQLTGKGYSSERSRRNCSTSSTKLSVSPSASWRCSNWRTMSRVSSSSATIWLTWRS